LVILNLRAQPLPFGIQVPKVLQSILTAHFRKRRSVMEWERLIRFGLLGNASLESYAILLVRVALGVFFAISGGNKLFVAARTKVMYETLVAARIPFPQATTYFVSAAELVCGCLLAVGLLSSLACFVLLVDILVAILTTHLAGNPKGLSPLNWVDDFLYFPEVLYALFFVWLICSGPGKLSLDYLIAARLDRG
jgi:putative oxidoreductase